jgi:membrane protease YdiL (CAAX protease family)
MNTLINKIKENTLLTILVALFLGAFVFITSKYLASWTTPFVEKYIALNYYTQNTIFKFYILILSLIGIWIVNNKSFSNYGFIKPKNINYSKMTLVSIGILLASMILGSILFVGILRNYFPTDNNKTFPSQSILQMILTVWIWSSITEEFLSRGLVQGFMNHLKNKKFLGLSIPVIFSGLFFGAMHLGLIKAGMAYWFVGMIVSNATVVGLLAAYYREKSESILPAIYIHILANVVGSAPYIIMILLGIKPPSM